MQDRPDTEPHAATRPARDRWRWWRVAGLVVVAAGVLAAYTLLPLQAWLIEVARVLRGLGGVGVALYFGVYTVASLFVFPAALLTLSAGVAWGPLGGLAAAIPAAAIAALTAFSIGRLAFRGRLRASLLARPKVAAVERAINAKGARLVFLMRFSPILPFPILNYVLGMTRIPAVSFVAATATGMLPISFMYTWTGALLGELGGVGDGPPKEVGALNVLMTALGIAATVFVTWWVGRAARAALAEVEAEAKDASF